MELPGFRLTAVAKTIIGLFGEHRNVLINWAVGVGKSHNVDGVIREATEGNDFDLVIVLLPTRGILDERQWIQNPPQDYKIVNLRPRPTLLCGPKLNAKWKVYESKGLGLVGRKLLCETCPNKADCYWIDQYGANLKGTDVLFATQAHLNVDPLFITRITEQIGAHKTLLIFDEANVSLASYRRKITKDELIQFHELMSSDLISIKLKDEWLLYLEALTSACTEDLRLQGDWFTPYLPPGEALLIQRLGINRYGDEYRFIGYDLKAFGASPLESREKLGADLIFSAPPLASAKNVLLYSGTTEPEILKMRLGLEFYNAYKNYRFMGEGTRWLNIASSLGTASHFSGNSEQILDFFAELIILRWQAGLRVLLISKKKWAEFCVEKLNDKFKRRGYIQLTAVLGSDDYDIDDQNIVPIIHYGVIGINKFEEFECAYCLNSYYTTSEILSQTIQDSRASDERIDVEISVSKNPRRRFAAVANQKHCYTDVAELANPMLKTLEMGTVIQAIGRVRPFTKTREVITFQNDVVEQYPYDAEFHNLEEIRQHFGVKKHIERRSDERYDAVQELKTQGLKQKVVAEKFCDKFAHSSTILEGKSGRLALISNLIRSNGRFINFKMAIFI